MGNFSNKSPEIITEKKCSLLLGMASSGLMSMINFYDCCGNRSSTQINKALIAVADSDPEFILQLAVYMRHCLNIRIMTNYILAFTSVHEKTRPYFDKYFGACMVLPTDIIEFCEFLPLCNFFKQEKFKQLCLLKFNDRNEIRKHLVFPSCVKRAIALKFQDFTEF